MKIVKVFFDEWDLTQFCHVRNISTMLQAPRTNVFQIHPDRDGAYFKQSTLGQITVEIKLSIRSNTLDNIDYLNRILHTREPKKLFIDDRPDRYLMAILSSDSTPISGRYYASTFTLKFISPDSFWRSTEGVKTLYSDDEGRIVVDDLGTADTPLNMEIEFEGDCGHLAIVTPNAHIELGNPQEVDTIEVPPSEFALNEEMDSMEGWTKLATSDLSRYLPESSDSLIATGQPKTNQWGLILDSEWQNVNTKWNGVFYKKDFDAGLAMTEAANFNYRGRIDLEDLSGSTNALVVMHFVIYDTEDKPLMSMAISDEGISRNKLTVRFLIGNGGEGDNNVFMAHETTMDKIRGWISMDKMGNKFDWKVHNDATAPPTTVAPPAIKVGDIVTLKNSATTIYDWSGRALRLSDTIKGVSLRVAAIRDSPKGRYRLDNAKGGWIEGFFEADAIQQASVAPPKTPTSSGPEQKTFSGMFSDLGQKAAKGMAIGLFKYSGYPPYSVGSINSTVVKRVHTSNLYDIPNTFMTGDTLSIVDSDIMLNGTTFDGQISYDSRPLYVEGGVPSEIALLPSAWAEMPKAKISYEKRWL